VVIILSYSQFLSDRPSIPIVKMLTRYQVALGTGIVKKGLNTVTIEDRF